MIKNINVPAYVVASFSNDLNSYSTARGFIRLHGQKWLRYHDNQEWPDYYDPSNVEDLRRFFDRYLKDIDNDWERTPIVRANLIDTGNPAPKTGQRIIASSFPSKEIQNKILSFDVSSQVPVLSPTPPPLSKLSYNM